MVRASCGKGEAARDQVINDHQTLTRGFDDGIFEVHPLILAEGGGVDLDLALAVNGIALAINAAGVERHNSLPGVTTGVGNVGTLGQDSVLAASQTRLHQGTKVHEFLLRAGR